MQSETKLHPTKRRTMQVIGMWVLIGLNVEGKKTPNSLESSNHICDRPDGRFSEVKL